MAVPTVYRSTDAGAPVVSPTTLGSVLAVIRACLVDGYGSKSPAGWTEEFTDAPNNTAVFRNSTAAGGTGCYVRVSDNNSAIVYRPVGITTYASMSDVDTGTAGTPERYIYRRPNNVNTATGWALVATAKAFWLNVWSLSGGLAGLAGAGDAISFVASDAYRYFCAGSTVNYNPNVSWLGSHGHGPGSVTDGGLSFARDHLGISGPVGYGSLIRWANTALGSGGYPATPSVTGADNACAPYYLAGAAVLRGRLPGVFVPLHAVSAIAPGTLDTSGLTGSGSECLMMRADVSACGVWIETALDWGD